MKISTPFRNRPKEQQTAVKHKDLGTQRTSRKIPAMGIEPILPKKRDFESRASTNSATPASFS